MRFVFILLALVVSTSSFSDQKTVIRLGVQTGGTVEWELPVLKEHLAAQSNDIDLETFPIANSEAGKAALQSGQVDIIVTDWIWVSKLREQGDDLTFYPYSDMSGAFVVPGDSKIQSLADLKGKRLGIAGGEMDKNWLLLQALAEQQLGLDLNTSVTKVFAAPKEINALIKQGKLDAALNYWHFAARLEAEGYRTLLAGPDVLMSLSVTDAVANLGFVFKRGWAEHHKVALTQFFDASKQAKQSLCKSDSAWQKITPLIQVDDSSVLGHIHQKYCLGNIEHWGAAEQKAAEKVFALLHKQSRQVLTGNSETIQQGTFW